MGMNAAPAKPDRLDAVDLLRGLVMVIMALDHVRDFFSNQYATDPTDLTKTTAALFLTRWITHFCAPTFIFLAGTGAFLSRSRGKTKGELSWLLLTRGLWFAFFEVVINNGLSWSFNLDTHHYGAGTFWAIGWSMVILSVLVYLPTSAVAAIGVATVAFHNFMDGVTAEQITAGLHSLGLPDWVEFPRVLWVILHRPGEAPVIPKYDITFGTGYCVIPWAGVMASGYGFGGLLLLQRDQRRREVFGLGAVLTLLFVVLRLANVYGDGRPWEKQPTTLFTIFSVLNCTKYPPSLLYALMTIGPGMMVMAIFDRPLGALAKPIITFGRVPMFFYILHIPLIHGLAVALDYYRFGWSPIATDIPWNLRKYPIPADYGVSLPWVYLIWVGVVLLLYGPCWWFAGVKRRSRSPWLSYV